MAVVAKKDIQTLTKQLNQEKCNILGIIKQEHVVIDPSFSRENFSIELESKLHRMIENQKDSSNDTNSISLDELELMVERFDSLDKRLSEPKISKPNTVARKENSTIKRKYTYAYKR